MTSPVPDEESLAFEAAAVRAVMGGLSAGLEEVVTAILAAFEATLAKAGGELSPKQARDAGTVVAQRIAAITWEPMRPRIVNVSAEGQALGREQAVRSIPAGKRRQRAERTPKRTVRRDVPDPDAAVRAALSEAAKIARSGIRTRADAAAVAGRVKQGKARAEGHARWVANDGLNAGTAAVARTIGERLLWVPERNACLDCLAHAGWVVEPGKPFPAVSFDPAAKGVRVVEFPPLHPGCRCRAQVTDLPAGKPDGGKSSTSKADALAREARRTVVYQWTDHASGAAAQRAAEALLAAGADLPGTVVQRARRALRRGGVRRPK